jgi:hypothetical protein
MVTPNDRGDQSDESLGEVESQPPADEGATGCRRAGRWRGCRLGRDTGVACTSRMFAILLLSTTKGFLELVLHLQEFPQGAVSAAMQIIQGLTWRSRCAADLPVQRQDQPAAVWSGCSGRWGDGHTCPGASGCSPRTVSQRHPHRRGVDCLPRHVRPDPLRRVVPGSRLRHGVAVPACDAARFSWAAGQDRRHRLAGRGRRPGHRRRPTHHHVSALLIGIVKEIHVG